MNEPVKDLVIVPRRDDYFGTTIELRGFIKSEHSAITPCAIEKVPVGGYVNPFLVLDADQLQRFVNDLWELGIRPDKAAGSAGQVEALRYHLEDMRTIVF